jgi:hypothetical protein
MPTGDSARCFQAIIAWVAATVDGRYVLESLSAYLLLQQTLRHYPNIP